MLLAVNGIMLLEIGAVSFMQCWLSVLNMNYAMVNVKAMLVMV